MRITFRNLGRVIDYTLYTAVVQYEYDAKVDIRDNYPISTGMYLREYGDGMTMFDEREYKNLTAAKNAARKVIRNW